MPVPASEAQAYGGVARVQVGSTCSGVLLNPGGASAEAPAYVLSNGHCAFAFGSDEVVIDRAGSGSVTFNYFHDAAERPVYGVRRVRFSTMKGTDLAILELDATHREISGKGIQGFELERDQPDLDEPVVVVGAPLQGAGAPSYLRVASCRLESEVGLLLERHWHWFEFQRNRCADIAPGSSGSPVISRGNRKLLGLINTTTLGSEGATDCWSGRPCEADGVRGASLEATSYAVSLVGVAECFDVAGVLQPGLPGCLLDDGRQTTLSPTWLGPRNPDRLGTAGARWNVTVGGSTFPYFRYKIGPAGSAGCRDTRGYGTPLAVGLGRRIDDRMPDAEGFHALCVLGEVGEAADGRGQNPLHASMVNLEIDRTPPRVPARFEFRDFGSSWGAFAVFSPPEISAYTFKFGPASETSCADSSGYRPFVTSPFTIAKTGAPIRFCAIGFDLADNPSPPLDTLLG